MMAGETFGQRLRYHRVTLGLSQNQLARRAGCDPAYVNRLERAPEGMGSQPSRHVVLSFANVLELATGQTDRLLFAAGLAPQEDWQTRAVRAETALAAIGRAFEDYTGAEGDAEPPFIRRVV